MDCRCSHESIVWTDRAFVAQWGERLFTKTFHEEWSPNFKWFTPPTCSWFLFIRACVFVIHESFMNHSWSLPQPCIRITNTAPSNTRSGLYFSMAHADLQTDRESSRSRAVVLCRRGRLEVFLFSSDCLSHFLASYIFPQHATKSWQPWAMAIMII